MTDDGHLQRLVAAELDGLGELLATLPDDDWNSMSLCQGWRVREVAAHLTMAARYDAQQFQAELAAAGYDFTTLSNTIATRDAELPTDRLVADVRSPTMREWVPPGGGWIGALTHVVIHTLDITVALRQPRIASDMSARTVLDALTAGGVHRHFGLDISAQRYRAVDLDWSHGVGDEVAGPAGELIALLSGRELS